MQSQACSSALVCQLVCETSYIWMLQVPHFQNSQRMFETLWLLYLPGQCHRQEASKSCKASCLTVWCTSPVHSRLREKNTACIQVAVCLEETIQPWVCWLLSCSAGSFYYVVNERSMRKREGNRTLGKSGRYRMAFRDQNLVQSSLQGQVSQGDSLIHSRLR